MKYVVYMWSTSWNIVGSERVKPFNTQEDKGVPFHRNFNSILRSDHKKIIWSSRLWGRRKEPILGYVPKNDEKKNLVHEGLKKMKISKLH